MLRTALQPKWLGALLLATVFAAVCGWLGAWQLEEARAEGRAQAIERAASLPVAPLTEVVEPQSEFPRDGSTRRVTASGSYAVDGQVLIAERQLDGQVGYWVVSPFVVDGTGATIPVLRGFVTDPESAPAPPTGRISLAGGLAPSESPRSEAGLADGVYRSIDLGLLVNRWDAAHHLERVAIELATGRERRLEEELANAALPPVSRDGERYAYTRRVPEGTAVVVQPLAPFGEPRTVATLPDALVFLYSFSSDDAALYATRTKAPATREAVRIDLATGEPTPLALPVPLSYRVVPSPDGRWLAIEGLVDGELHVLVAPTARPELAARVSSASGLQPLWRADSRELYYHGHDARLYAVALATDAAGAPTFEAPAVLFDTGTPAARHEVVCAASPDGQRFLLARPLATDRGPAVHLLTRWLDSLSATGD